MFYFIFQWSDINNTRFHCDNSMPAYSVSWASLAPPLYLHSPTPKICFLWPVITFEQFCSVLFLFLLLLRFLLRIAFHQIPSQHLFIFDGLAFLCWFVHVKKVKNCVAKFHDYELSLFYGVNLSSVKLCHPFDALLHSVW